MLRIILLFLFLIPSQSLAEDGPSQLVKKVILLIKKQGDPSPMVDYVYWQKIYKDLPEKNRVVMNVSNENELKEFYRRVLKSPTVELDNVLRSRMEEKLGAEKTEDLLSNLKETAIKKEKELKSRLKNTKYLIGKSKIKGDRAKVPLTYLYKNKKKTEDVSVIKIKNVWYLENFGKEFTFRKK